LQIEKLSPVDALIHRNEQSGSPWPMMDIQPLVNMHADGSTTSY
jgi:hypothetical protein